MEIQIKRHHDALVAEVTGELDGKTAPELDEVVSPLFQEGTPVLLDLTRTTYMSSAGLRSLLLLHREASAQGTPLVLVGVCREIKDVMVSTGFLRFFQTADTLGEVTRLLRRESSGPAASLGGEERSRP